MDWKPVAQWLERTIGYSLDAGKYYLLESSCRELLIAWNCADPNALITAAERDLARRQILIEACTINESLFFRDEGLWPALRERVLPELANEGRYRGCVQVLQCAASTGQELYTLAMTWAEGLTAKTANIRLEITATDIDATALARAKNGRYSDFEVGRGLSAERRERFFTRIGNDWQARPELRARVKFQTLNLHSEFSFPSRFDLIFCRNVLIYFDVAGKRAVLGRLGRLLNGYGYLILGGAETTFGIAEGWNPRRIANGTFYQRTY